MQSYELLFYFVFSNALLSVWLFRLECLIFVLFFFVVFENRFCSHNMTCTRMYYQEIVMSYDRLNAEILSPVRLATAAATAAIDVRLYS